MATFQRITSDRFSESEPIAWLRAPLNLLTSGPVAITGVAAADTAAAVGTGALLVTLSRAPACGVLTCGWATAPQPATATAAAAAATTGSTILAEPLAGV